MLSSPYYAKNYAGIIDTSLRSALLVYVTEFAKRGLPHTSDLQTSTIHNFRCVKAISPQIVQFRALT